MEERVIEKGHNELQCIYLSDNEARQSCGLAGQLNWSSSQTCPDLSYQACGVNTSIEDAAVNDLKTANKYILKLKNVILYVFVIHHSQISRMKHHQDLVSLHSNEKYDTAVWKSKK